MPQSDTQTRILGGEVAAGPGDENITNPAPGIFSHLIAIIRRTGRVIYQEKFEHFLCFTEQFQVLMIGFFQS